MAPPNFLIFLADDQGYGDAGCYGADELETPALDALARGGARCTQWYGGAPVCSASRAALLSGRRPAGAGVPGNIPPAWDAPGVRPEVSLLPELLRAGGYQTYMAGKWHLGQADGQRPHQRGFDDWFGFLHGCVDYYSHTFYWLLRGGLPPRHDLWHNGEEAFRNGEYLTDLIAERAIAYLRRAKQDGRPFFLYVPFNAPHYPMQAPDDAMDRFAHLGPARRLTAALLWCYDRALGRVLDELDRLGLGENTCVFASSDHGPSREANNWPDGTQSLFDGGSTGGLRGEKFSLFEGGIRIPGIWRWPGKIQPGTTLDTPMHHHDVLPTCLAAAGIDKPPGLDGCDIGATLAGGAGPPRDALQWSFRGEYAVRCDSLKLVTRGDAPALLFDLEANPEETRDLTAQRPAWARELFEMIRRGPAGDDSAMG